MSYDLKKMENRSMFGNQVSSKKTSSAAYGFGSSSRQQANKVFVSAEHARLASHGAPPGPSAYSLRGAVAGQPDSRKTSAPNWAFGTAERFTYEKKSASNPGLPGPCTAAMVARRKGRVVVCVVVVGFGKRAAAPGSPPSGLGLTSALAALAAALALLPSSPRCPL